MLHWYIFFALKVSFPMNSLTAPFCPIGVFHLICLLIFFCLRRKNSKKKFFFFDVRVSVQRTNICDIGLQMMWKFFRNVICIKANLGDCCCELTELTLWNFSCSFKPVLIFAFFRICYSLNIHIYVPCSRNLRLFLVGFGWLQGRMGFVR